MRERGWEDSISQQGHGTKDGKAAKHDNSLLHGLHFVVLLGHLQLELFGHHNVHEEVLVLGHGRDDLDGIRPVHSTLHVNVDHLLDLTLGVVLHLPCLSFPFR